jgi:uncharacterized damage-inducible protein DinB
MKGSEFLQSPGLPGPWGGVMDEYARAAAELCELLEALSQEEFLSERESPDPDTTSVRAIATHCINSAYGYSNAIRRVRGDELDTSGRIEKTALSSPEQVRAHLKAALHHTEDTLVPLADADAETIIALTFPSGWGQTYDPESILEHGIVHLLRHRRQIERWKR